MVDERTPVDDAVGQGTDPVQRWLPWLLRLAWIATGVAGSAAVSDAVDGRSTGVELVATWGAAAGWVIGVAAMAVPATLSLTAARVVVPLCVVAAVASLVGGAPAGPGAVFLGMAVASTAVALSGELGRAFVQASAYGDEERFPLRPPLGFAVAAVLAWILWSAGLVTGALLTGAQIWVAGIPLVALAAVGAVVLGRRWHLLSRRWLVFVPAGLVLHDRVVLGETLMLRRSQLDRLRLAPADTEALDLTGPASGHAIEMTVREMVTVLLPSSTEHPNGRAVHVRAFLAGPSRPGSALAAARRRRFPVG
ncbi:hypothetical protein BH23ACT3_BH23ACT3_07090 [soil metagenome]